eukprot:m.514952 g.514952  ORF g.514952 m.514952 type:complete len:81 (-) comp21915_c0_seq12:167-409(-)
MRVSCINAPRGSACDQNWSANPSSTAVNGRGDGIHGTLVVPLTQVTVKCELGVFKNPWDTGVELLTCLVHFIELEPPMAD